MMKIITSRITRYKYVHRPQCLCRELYPFIWQLMVHIIIMFKQQTTKLKATMFLFLSFFHYFFGEITNNIDNHEKN